MKQMFIRNVERGTLKRKQNCFSTVYDDFIKESCIIKGIGL